MATDPGCCGVCHGSGIDVAAYETNGKCWDCLGTGHAHALTRRDDGGDDEQP